MQKQFTNTPTFYVYLRIILISWFLSFFFTLEVRAQSPGLAWRKGYFAPVNPITNAIQSKATSGEDWNEDISQFKENGVQTGFVCAGYCSFINTEVPTNSCGIQYLNHGADGDFEIKGVSGVPDRLQGFEPAHINRIDKNGNLIWFKTCGNMSGDFFKVKQVNGGIVAVGETHSFDNGGSIPLYYNPTNSSHTLLNCHSFIEAGEIKSTRLGFIAKTDNNGNILWQNCYGPDGISSVNNSEYQVGLLDFEEDSNGDILVIGSATSILNSSLIVTDKVGKSNYLFRPFVLKINGITGDIIWKQLLSVGFANPSGALTTSNIGLFNNYVGNSLSDKPFFINLYCGYHSKGEQIKITNTGSFIIQGFEYSYPATSLNSSNYPNHMFSEDKVFLIEGFDNGSGLSFSGSPALFGIGLTEIGNTYESNNGLCYLPNVGGGNGAISLAFIEKSGNYHDVNLITAPLSNLSNYTITNIASAVNGGQVSTADLRVGATVTSDGGIALVSVVKAASSISNSRCSKIVSPLNSDNQGHLSISECSDANNYLVGECDYWDTETKIWKTTPITSGTTATIKWSKTFDAQTGPLGCFPDNYKNEVCMFAVAESEDGGLVVTGKTTDNFDDCYVAKVYGDCALSQNATNPNGTNYSQNFSSILNNITSDLNITSDVNVRGRVVVHNGVTLHLTNNAIMHFADSKQVGFTTILVIEPGGKLIMDPGTKMTGLSACNNVWDGVIVKGNCSQAQQVTGAGMFVTSNQGYVYLRNCTIENARVAFKIFNPSDYYGSGHCGGGGGIINASGVTFANCYRAVEFKKYHNPTINGVEPLNKSVLQYCTFYIDNNYNYDAGPFSEFISMWDVSGVQLHGNTYSNNTTYSGPITDWSKPNNLRAMGIYSIDAKYFVDNKLNTPSQFNNLDYGVYAQNSRDVAISVAKSNFNNNYHSIELEAANESSVRLNHFNLVQFPYEDNNIPFKPFQVGIVRSKHFKYEYNQLSQSPNATNKSTTGNYFSNTGIGRSADNKSLGNTFSGFSYATVSNYQNRFFNSTSGTVNGLNFICNTNTNNSKADYTIYNQSATAFDGIAEFIGDYNGGNPLSALDHFSTTLGNTFFNINNKSQHAITWFCDPNTGFPLSLSGLIYTYNGDYNGGCSTPPSNLLSNPYTESTVYDTYQLAQKEINYKNELSQHNYYENMLNSLIDNGNTVQLTANVASTLPPEVQARRLELLNQSPFLSTDVLLELCNKINVFGDAVVFEILMANPDVTREVAFEELLINMVEQNIFPEWMYESITANSDQVTYRTILNRNDSKAISKMMQTFRDVSYSLQNDTTGFDHTVYRHWLQLLQNPEADMTLAEEYMEEANFELANAIIDSIPIKYVLNEKQEREHADFRDWMNMRILWLTNDLAIDSLDALNFELLKSFADDNNSSAGTKAKNVVNFFYGGNYRNYPELPEDGQSQSRATIQSKTVNKMEDRNYVKIYPNPSNNYVYVEYKTPSGNNAHIEVFDAAGIRVLNEIIQGSQSLKVIDASTYSDGTYFYKIIYNNEVLGQGNFIIQK